MDHRYRLEDVDPKLTEALEKAKAAQRERQRKAWEAERQNTPQESPVQQQQNS
jgi:hypothetical protein